MQSRLSTTKLTNLVQVDRHGNYSGAVETRAAQLRLLGYSVAAIWHHQYYQAVRATRNLAFCRQVLRQLVSHKRNKR